MHLTLRQAEQQVMASKSTILRAIKSGRMSAERDGPEGSYRIQPSELFRVFPPKSGSAAAPADEADGEAMSTGDAIALARLTAETEKLSALLDAERRRADELRDDRDSWRAQAERLALVHRAATANDFPSPATQQPVQRAGLLVRLGRALKG